MHRRIILIVLSIFVVFGCSVTSDKLGLTVTLSPLQVVELYESLANYNARSENYVMTNDGVKVVVKGGR